tara:strand:+ start:416 stop:706 length:291 start_codon:yes stop_codon:yes gene_type:complete
LIGIQRRRTARLIKNVRLPILRLVEIDKPSARTVHGLIPAPAVIINDSPKPNKLNPKHRINTVSGDGEKFRGLSELQLTFGTDLTEKIFMVILDNV